MIYSLVAESHIVATTLPSAGWCAEALLMRVMIIASHQQKLSARDVDVGQSLAALLWVAFQQNGIAGDADENRFAKYSINHL